MKTIFKALLFVALFCSSVQAATVFKDRVRETTSTSGQNDITLGGAVTKYRTFASALSDGDYVPVVIVHTSQNQWQACYAYFRASTNKLEISSVKTNSAGTQPTKLSFAAGTKEVWIDLIADAIDNFASGGSGTVTLVGVSTNASYLTVGSSPITSSGTITLNKTTGLTANRVVATPDGVSGTADLRALVAADIPNLDASKITTGLAAIATSGSASDLTAGTAAIARGGTNSGTALSGSSIMVSNGSAIVQGSAGTSTTVLHGNAAGTPSYSAVSLTADVSGILPSANGGTANGFTKFSGPATSEKTFTLPNASASILTDNTAVTVAQGGTGQTSYTDGQLLIGNTVGNTLTKATLTPGSGVSITNGNGSITISATGTGGTVTSAGLSTDSDIYTVGSSPITTSGTITLNKTTGLAANKVLATPDGSTGTASLRSLVAADIPSLDASKIGSGILASTYGGTGNGFTKFSGPATSEKTFTLPNASATILTDNAAVTVAQGGTGITSGTSGGIPYFSGTGTIASSAALTANQIVLGGGAGTTPATLGSLGTTTTVLHGNAAGAPTFGAIVSSDIASNAVTDAKLRQSGALAVVGRSANSTGDVADIQATAASDAVLRESGSVIGFGTIATGGIANLAVTNAKIANSTIDLTAKVTGILPSANGGTANGFTKFSGPTTAEKTFTLPDASATILTSNTAVTVGQGGTGQTSYTDGQLLIGNTTGNTLTKATLTPGSGISITNGAGSITISASASDYIDPLALQNVGLSISVGSSATTIALKQQDGSTDPSTGSAKCNIAFASNTASAGSTAMRSVTSSTTLVISNGSSLGFASTTATQRVWVGAIDNSGTVELCCWTSLSGTNLKRFNDGDIVTTTAEGGAGAADSAQTIYSTTARTSKALRVLGYYEIQAAGSYAWTNSPTVVRVMQPGLPRTGDEIQSVISVDGANASGTTTIPQDNTTPQSSEGNQYMSLAITPRSSLNVLRIEHRGNYSSSAPQHMTCALFQDSTADALKSMAFTNPQGNYMFPLFVYHEMQAGTTSSTTFKIRAGGSAAGTTYFNSNSGALYNGTFDSSLKIREIFQ